jgi:hypothetical protein
LVLFPRGYGEAVLAFLGIIARMIFPSNFLLTSVEGIRQSEPSPVVARNFQTVLEPASAARSLRAASAAFCSGENFEESMPWLISSMAAFLRGPLPASRSADRNTGAAVGDDLALRGRARAAPQREQMSVEKRECAAPKHLSRHIPVRGLYLLMVLIGIFSIE